jgi:hypothetical protein
VWDFLIIIIDVVTVNVTDNEYYREIQKVVVYLMLMPGTVIVAFPKKWLLTNCLY